MPTQAGAHEIKSDERRPTDYVTLILRISGGLVCGLFLFQTVWSLLHPDTSNFWAGCFWLGQGMIGIIAAGIGGYLEIRSMMPSVFSRRVTYLLHRAALVIFYFWVGCYAVGGMGKLDRESHWKAADHAIGIFAWCVSLANIFSACIPRKSGGEEQLKKSHAAAHEALSPRPSAIPSADRYGVDEIVNTPQAPTFGDDDLEHGGEHDASLPKSNAPASGWAQINDKPFGCA